MNKKEIKIVLGHSFGDEGKGVTVQYLCKDAINRGLKPLVIRFSGGPQAAHTINHNNIEHICSTYGSGVLLNVPTLIWNTAYFDPISAKNEYDILREKIDNVPPLYVMSNTRVVTPYDIAYGRKDLKVLSDGTCGRGIYSTFKRNNDINGPKITINNVIDDSNLYELENYFYPENVHSDCEISFEGETFENMRLAIKNNEYDFFNIVNGPQIINFFDVIIFEGSQGLLLDMDRGFYPHVTPSKVGLNALADDPFLRELLYNADVYVVTRTYLTRHGNGYKPCEYGFNFDLTNKHETNIYNQFQGNFKTGLIDFDLLNEAFNRHCFDNYCQLFNLKMNLVVTHWDLLDSVNEFHYIQNGKRQTLTQMDNICDLFLCYPKMFCFNNMYINDSVESNLKLITKND